MKIKMPQIYMGICRVCKYSTEHYFDEHGAIAPCNNCYASSAYISKSLKVKQ